jgi:glutamate formiminotransferase/formiminotetrahydrofolate cyclodeaminase
LTAAERSREVRNILESLRGATNPKMASDVTTGIALANAAITGALANVEINLAELKDPPFVADVQMRVAAIKA